LEEIGKHKQMEMAVCGRKKLVDYWQQKLFQTMEQHVLGTYAGKQLS
jgi:hypothetical protein